MSETLTQQALRTSELSYRRLFEAAQDGILILDAYTGRITDVNPFLTKLLGFSSSEMVGKTVGELSPFKDIVSNQAMLGRLQESGHIRYEDLPLETKDGRKIAVEFVSNVYQAGEKKVIQCNIRDITKRKQAEIAARLLESIVASSNDAIIGKDLAGNITSWNEGAERIFGYSADEMLGTPLTRLIPANRKDEENQILAKIRHGKSVEHFETLRQTKEGRLINVSVTASPIKDATGKIVGVSKVARDTTEFQKLEQKFHQAQKMESIGQLAGGIAHDFNNILAAIVGNVYLAKMDGAQNPAVLDHLEEISKATERATGLINHILTFSRQNKPEREPICLNDVVVEALKLLRASLPATIRIHTELVKTPTVLANATAIHQVIMNLGTNAWHAMRDRPGTLKIEMNIVEVDADFITTHPELTLGKYVRLSVSDTGCGMDRKTISHIFEPFFTTKGVGEGTGLGLAVVHGIMKSHYGAISVYSQPDEGTTFHLYFPTHEIEIVPPEIEAAPIPRGQNERILFVDDEETLAGLGKTILERLGYAVTIKTNVTEALAAFQKQPDDFDLVITDFAMPLMDGAKLGHQLLLIRPSLPILLTSGYSGLMSAEKVRELGFRELLIKPTTGRTLGEAVYRALHPQRTPN
jgi:PAS domain S-box-containing protein